MIADDPDLLGVLNSVENLPRHNVMFAAVQFLMLRDGPGPLGRYYASFDRAPLDPIGAGPHFTDFVMAHEDEITSIGRTRYTQTNECRRCAALLPAVWATPAARFHLIDLGTSAGLNLHMDRYRYRWGLTSWGQQSPVLIETEVRGREVEPRSIEILSRIGLDLHPIDPSDESDRLWLEALIWPEHHRRRTRLRAAIDLAAANPAHLVEGDVVSILVDVLAQIPEGETIVLINSFILNQFDENMTAQFGDIVDHARGRSPIHRVSMEWLDRDADGADLAIDVGDGLQPIGRAEPHGEWLDLYARP